MAKWAQLGGDGPPAPVPGYTLMRGDMEGRWVAPSGRSYGINKGCILCRAADVKAAKAAGFKVV